MHTASPLIPTSQITGPFVPQAQPYQSTKRENWAQKLMPVLEFFSLNGAEGSRSRRVLSRIEQATQRINRLFEDPKLSAIAIRGGHTTESYFLSRSVVISDRRIGLTLTGKEKGLLFKLEDISSVKQEVKAIADKLGLKMTLGTSMISWSTLSGRSLFSLCGLDNRIIASDFCQKSNGKAFVNLAIVLEHPKAAKFSVKSATEIGKEFEESVTKCLPEIKALSLKLQRISRDAQTELEECKAIDKEADAALANLKESIKEQFEKFGIRLGLLNARIWPSLNHQDSKTFSGCLDLKTSGAIFTAGTLNNPQILNEEVLAIKSEITELFSKEGIKVGIDLSPPRKIPVSDQILVDREGDGDYPLLGLKEKFNITLNFPETDAVKRLSSDSIDRIVAKLVGFRK